MLDMHARLHALRQRGVRGDPIQSLADELARDVFVMYFDEMQASQPASLAANSLYLALDSQPLFAGDGRRRCYDTATTVCCAVGPGYGYRCYLQPTSRRLV